jgi:hypothetical protein
MQDWRGIDSSEQYTTWIIENVKSFVQQHPKLAIMIYSKIGIPSRLKEVLELTLIPDILLRPDLYFSSTDALCLLLDHLQF